MGKKKIRQGHNSLWSLFGFWRVHKHFSGKFNIRTGKKSFASLISGFTLVELIVVLGILSILVIIFLVAFDPVNQLNKAQDSQRENDLFQVRNALDTFYNDKNCYPPSLSFGTEFREGSVIYMKKLPTDCRDASCYYYQTDVTAACPQWNVLYTKVRANSNDTINRCPLEQLDDCLPINYQESGFNYCVVSGDVDCAYISSSTLPVGPPLSPGPSVATPTPTPGSGVGSTTPTITPTSGPSPTQGPTQTPTPTSSCSQNYSCTGSPLRCNVVPAGTGQYCTSNCNAVCP